MRTHGISPSFVNVNKCRSEMLRALAASRGRSARGLSKVMQSPFCGCVMHHGPLSTPIPLMARKCAAWGEPARTGDPRMRKRSNTSNCAGLLRGNRRESPAFPAPPGVVYKCNPVRQPRISTNRRGNNEGKSSQKNGARSRDDTGQ